MPVMPDPSRVTPNTDQEYVLPFLWISVITRARWWPCANGTAKASSWKDYRRKHLSVSDAEKIERVFSLAGGLETNLSLIDDVALFLSSNSNSGNFLAFEALKFAPSTGRRQLGQIKGAMDNTKSKAMAVEAHKKTHQSWQAAYRQSAVSAPVACHN